VKVSRTFKVVVLQERAVTAVYFVEADDEEDAEAQYAQGNSDYVGLLDSETLSTLKTLSIEEMKW
jgi:hypothetical protein